LGRGLQPIDLLKTATELIQPRRGKVRQANLRRAQSTIYYALFHTLARCCADTLVGGCNAAKSNSAWRQVYRALEHGRAKNACKAIETIKKFPIGIQDFASVFVTMQAKRHEADYEPEMTLLPSAVDSDIRAAESAIVDFMACPKKDTTAFAVWVLFKTRPK
jgi:hypothetical protein